ncbi:MAG: NAD-dependent epimerase/dehydratase family protein, partial [Promethearchaeota archaeon]
ESVLAEYAEKRILVTGGAGCIGSNLVQTLLQAEPEKIIIIDDLSASHLWNIPKSPQVVFIHGSVLDDEKMREAFSLKPQYIFHLAAHFANQNSIDHPENDLLTNALGTLKTLRYAVKTDCKRFVYASSGCSVYGNHAPLPLKEDFVSLHLDTPYQITKLVGELYCNFFYNYYKLPVVNARYFNVFGPREVPGKYRNVIPNFIWWAMQERPLPITGTGKETRDFTYVGDIIEGTLRMGVFEEAVGEAINLASGTETRILDVAEQINNITGNPAGLEYQPVRDWDKIKRRRASIEKAGKLLGYTPKTSFRAGLKRTYEWFLEFSDEIEQAVAREVSWVEKYARPDNSATVSSRHGRRRDTC